MLPLSQYPAASLHAIVILTDYSYQSSRFLLEYPAKTQLIPSRYPASAPQILFFSPTLWVARFKLVRDLASYIIAIAPGQTHAHAHCDAAARVFCFVDTTRSNVHASRFVTFFV